MSFNQLSGSAEERTPSLVSDSTRGSKLSNRSSGTLCQNCSQVDFNSFVLHYQTREHCTLADAMKNASCPFCSAIVQYIQRSEHIDKCNPAALLCSLRSHITDRGLCQLGVCLTHPTQGYMHLVDLEVVGLRIPGPWLSSLRRCRRRL